MKIIQGKTVSARFNDHEANALNNAMQGNTCETARDFFNLLAEKALGSVQIDTSSLEAEIEQLKQQIANNEDVVNKLNEDIAAYKQKCFELTNDMNKNGETATIIQNKLENVLNNSVILQPGAMALVKEVANKLNCKPEAIVNDYILRYNVKQRAQIFHPFYFTPQQAANIVETAK